MQSLHAMRNLIAVLLCLCLAPAAQAEDRGALQAAALFEQACVAYAGQTDALRIWVNARHLPVLAHDTAMIFSQGHPAISYVASTSDGQMVLVSQDDGACRVVVKTGNPPNIRQELTSLLKKNDVKLSTVSDKADAARGATQLLYRATLGQRRWLLSVTSEKHQDAPNLAPQITMLATVPSS
jgi:hypothetical protein